MELVIALVLLGVLVASAALVGLLPRLGGAPPLGPEGDSQEAQFEHAAHDMPEDRRL
jgi:hypothetical protein